MDLERVQSCFLDLLDGRSITSDYSGRRHMPSAISLGATTLDRALLVVYEAS